MNTASNPSFGFGKDVDGGGAATAIAISDATALKNNLANLGTSETATVFELKAGFYDFRQESPQAVLIRAKNLTIRGAAGDRVVLINFALPIDLGSADNILIQDLAFISDGTGPEDAIFLDGSGGSKDATNKVRITHCAFQGYFDIAIDSHSHRTRLLATIDHCLFFDSQPGQPLTPLTKKDKFRPFANRGAINIASVVDESSTPKEGEELPRKQGNSAVTVAFNVFVDVWRRCPRVGFPGNYGHVYNNLLYRWGYGNTENLKANGTDTWNGITVGNGGTALIQANRLIPGGKKLLGIQIDTASGTRALGSPKLPNELDNGATADSLKTDVTPQPDVTAASKVSWQDVVKQAGPRLADPQDSATPEAISRKKVLDALDSAKPK